LFIVRPEAVGKIDANGNWVHSTTVFFAVASSQVSSQAREPRKQREPSLVGRFLPGKRRKDPTRVLFAAVRKMLSAWFSRIPRWPTGNRIEAWHFVETVYSAQRRDFATHD
jgi:hypothetical protein